MDYFDLVKSGADATDKQKYLSEGGQVAVTIRIPKNLRDAGKELASLNGTTFSAMVRAGLIEQLTRSE